MLPHLGFQGMDFGYQTIQDFPIRAVHGSGSGDADMIGAFKLKQIPIGGIHGPVTFLAMPFKHQG